MPVYLYAIGRAPAEEPTATGLGGSPLRTIQRGELWAVVSDCVDRRPACTEDALWEHERAVEALMSTRDVLPARFGGVLGSDAEVRALLDERHEELTRTLDRVAGAVELGIRVAWARSDGAVERPDPGRSSRAPAVSGSQYLRAQAAGRRQASRIASLVDNALRPTARAVSTRPPAGDSPRIAAAYLVDSAQVERFRRRVDRLERDLPEAEIVCTGPWPPYSFVEGVTHG